ncbi:MAG: PglZ domain-containing protein [Cytophagaceae bacterium]|jgi:CheY-like chemotaxis protein|nr:PglZ domain-containing protein [Cytophagaceae bacterium]
MQTYTIVWADDEIDLLQPYILFLEQKGYSIKAFTNGLDAIEYITQQPVDVIFLDENMPGMNGLQTLEKCKEIRPAIPVVMITKNEEEHIMEEAIGSKIADYLIKPIHPNQVVMSLKKILHTKNIVSDKTIQNYRQSFMQISQEIQEANDFTTWSAVYRMLVRWELEIDSIQEPSLKEMLLAQKEEANQLFTKCIRKNYEQWISGSVAGPLFSHQILLNKVVPLVQQKPCFLIVLDNLRFDQWKVLESLLEPYYRVEKEELYCSILPTTTAYARNSLFSGLLPLEIDKQYKGYYQRGEEEGLNDQEEQFVRDFLKRKGLSFSISYTKITNLQKGRQLVDTLPQLVKNQCNIIVYNFIDMISHARSEMDVLKELAPDESAYRSLTKSWFMHSPLQEIISYLSEKRIPIILTTDHGTKMVHKPHKIIGERSTNSNLRYKTGKNLGYDSNQWLYEVKKPETIGLPKQNLSDSYVFAGESLYFVYPNNYNSFVQMYKNTLQHGGISLEEMIIPLIQLEPKN